MITSCPNYHAHFVMSDQTANSANPRHLSSLTPKKRSGAENSPSSKMFTKSAQDCTVNSCHFDAMHSCGRREQCARNAGALHKFSAAYGPDPRFSPPSQKRKTRSGYPRLVRTYGHAFTDIMYNKNLHHQDHSPPPQKKKINK